MVVPYTPSQVGSLSDHLPLAMHMRFVTTDDWPELQVYMATDPYVVVDTESRALAGVFRAPQSTAADIRG